MNEQETKNFQSFSAAIHSDIQKDLNNNILMFILTAMFSAGSNEQKDTVVSFIDVITNDITKFYTDKAKLDFNLNMLDTENLDTTIRGIIIQNLNPILKEIAVYKASK